MLTVSKSLPKPDPNKAGRGGLVETLGEGPGTFVGLAAKPLSETPGSTSVETIGDRTYVEVTVSAVDVARHGNVSNGPLWLGAHKLKDPASPTREDFVGYSNVNKTLAEGALKHSSADEITSVEDFQLQSVPRMLKRVTPKRIVGFKLHIPAMSDIEVLAPEVRSPVVRLMQDVFGADLIGLQTMPDLKQFHGFAVRHLGASPTGRHGDELMFKGHKVRLQVHGASINPDTIAEADYSRSHWDATTTTLMNKTAGQQVWAWLGRGDPTKNGPLTIDAFGDFLSADKSRVGKHVLIMFAPATRDGQAVYDNEQKAINNRCAALNKHFGAEVAIHVATGIAPTHKHHFLQARSDLPGQPAPIGLVVPVMDGMNLVAKEYYAAQDLGNPGALVLSRTAGAAQELTRAQLVNPLDRNSIVAGMERAVALTPDQRRADITAMQSVIWGHTAAHYNQNWSASLQAVKDEQRDGRDRGSRWVHGSSLGVLPRLMHAKNSM